MKTIERKRGKILRTKINIIHNYSSVILSEAQISLLNKGLNFCPTPNGPNYTQIMADLFHLERKMAWKHHFSGKDDDGEDGTDDTNNSDKNPFNKKARKTNMPDEYHEGIKQFKNCVQSDLIGSAKNTSSHKVKSNLTKDEKQALDSLVDLQKQGKIIIQSADMTNLVASA